MIWDFFTPENRVWYCWRLNGAAAYLRKDNELWQTAFKTIPFYERLGGFGGPEVEEPPLSLTLSCSSGSGNEVFLHPYLSSLPYILRVQEKLRIAPGQQISFTAALPPVLKFELTSALVLEETMPFILPRTLFGPDTMNGEFGHALAASLGQELKPAALIYCNIRIINNTKMALEPGHIAVYAEPLNVYVNQGILISDAVELLFSEADCRTNIIEIKDEAYRLVSKGLKCGVGETIARRSMDIIKDITRF